ncbi:MAG: hypothetical protein JWM19_797 [Actinomycetia bacterium]|nr:hypothetical protein [Actinomycetes bacterium]
MRSLPGGSDARTAPPGGGNERAEHCVEGGSCVEVSAPGEILVRDTTDRDGAALAFHATGAWRHLQATLR